jgi:DNA-binding GntR family transcriptional regulator
LHREKFSKVDCAYETLKNDILHIKIAPDFPLKINWLQETYGFGSTPLREALSRLEGDYLVKLIPNKGYYTAPVSIEELMELYRSRRIFKLQLLKEAMLFGDNIWESEIVRTHYLLAKQSSPSEGKCSYEDYIAWTQAHDAFDNALISAHRSPWANHFHIIATNHIRRQGRAFRILMPNFEDQKFSTGTIQSPTLRALYATDRYTDLRNAVLNRNFEQTETLVNKHLDMVMATYNELHDQS